MTQTTQQHTSIKIKYSQPYGHELLTPICDVGKAFAMLTGTKTLTRQALAVIKSLGYTIEVVQDKIEL